jgi:hypothetical protein
MFRKVTPTVVRHLRRGATIGRRAAVTPATRYIASSSVFATTSPYLFTEKRFKSTAAAVTHDEATHAIIDPPFKKILAANRGEIATRINRAAELGVLTAGIYSYEGENLLYVIMVPVFMWQCLSFEDP